MTEQLIWMPGHEGIDDNEMAHGLGKQGFEHPFIGPEQCCSISMLVAKKSARDWKVQIPQEILGPSANKARELLKLNRHQLRWVVGLLTGCIEKDDSITHILFDCEASISCNLPPHGSSSHVTFRHTGRHLM
jgi:hypothetical protein